MTLIEYLNGRPVNEQAQIARSWGTTIGYIRKACSKGQKIGPALCVAIEKETQGEVSRKDLRPEDWHLIWPELISKRATAA